MEKFAGSITPLGLSATAIRRTRSPCTRLPAFMLACAILRSFAAQAQSIPDLGFTTRVSPVLITQLAQKFTDAARNLLAQWKNFAVAQKADPFIPRLDAAKGREAEVLQLVNSQLNRIRWVSDQAHWGQVDYWATPAESVASNGGDCEDFAIAKYYMLKELGVPLQRLRITYVRALTLKDAHMVLAYYATPDAEPLILDNLDLLIKPASQRPDLIPVYSFNDDEVQLAKGGIKADPSQIRQWLSVQERLIAQSKT